MLLQGGVIVHVGLLPACLRVVLGVGLLPAWLRVTLDVGLFSLRFLFTWMTLGTCITIGAEWLSVWFLSIRPCRGKACCICWLAARLLLIGNLILDLLTAWLLTPLSSDKLNGMDPWHRNLGSWDMLNGTDPWHRDLGSWDMLNGTDPWHRDLGSWDILNGTDPWHRDLGSWDILNGMDPWHRNLGSRDMLNGMDPWHTDLGPNDLSSDMLNGVDPWHTDLGPNDVVSIAVCGGYFNGNDSIFARLLSIFLCWWATMESAGLIDVLLRIWDSWSTLRVINITSYPGCVTMFAIWILFIFPFLGVPGLSADCFGAWFPFILSF